MTKFTIKRGSQGHYYFPKELQEIAGKEADALANALTITVWNKDAEIDDVIDSVKIILQDLELRKKLEDKASS